MGATTAQHRSTKMAYPRVHIEHLPNPPVPADAQVDGIMGIYSCDQGTKEWLEHYRTVCGTSGRTTVQREAEELIHILVRNIELGGIASERTLKGNSNWVNLECWYPIQDWQPAQAGLYSPRARDILPKGATFLVRNVAHVMLCLLYAFCSLCTQARQILLFNEQGIPPVCSLNRCIIRLEVGRDFAFSGSSQHPHDPSLTFDLFRLSYQA
jgi:hypothetical protein